MRAPSCEHVSPSHCPMSRAWHWLSLCLRVPLTFTVEPLQRASHWAATAAGLILRISPWEQQATVGTRLSHLTSSQGLPQKREACLTHRDQNASLWLPSYWSVGSTQQMQLLPALSPAEACSAALTNPGQRVSGQRDETSTRGHPPSLSPLIMPTILPVLGLPLTPMSLCHLPWDEGKPLNQPERA